MTKKKSAIKNILWLNWLQVIKYFNGFFIGIWVIRSFGPDQFGDYGYTLSITNIFGVIVGLGLAKPLIKALSSQGGVSNILLIPSFLIFLFTSFLAYFFVLLYAFTCAQSEIKILLAITGLGLFFRFSDIYRCWFLSNLESKHFVNSQIISILFSAAAKSFVIILDCQIVFIAAVDLLSAGLLVILLERKKSLINLFSIYDFSFSNTLQSVKSMALRSLPFLLTGLVVTLNIQLDTLLVKYFMTAKDVGIYLAAVKIPLMISPVLISIEQTMLPINVKQLESEKSLSSVLNKTYSPFVYISLFISIVISLLSKPIINILYSNTYADSGYVLAIIAFIIFAGCVAKIQAQYCLFVDKNINVFYRQLLTLLLNCILDTLLIQKFGLVGAALGTLLSLALGILFYSFIDKKFAEVLINVLFKPDFYYLKLAFLNFSCYQK